MLVHVIAAKLSSGHSELLKSYWLNFGIKGDPRAWTGSGRTFLHWEVNTGEEVIPGWHVMEPQTPDMRVNLQVGSEVAVVI